MTGPPTGSSSTVAAHRSCLRDLSPPTPEPEPEWETPAEVAPGQGDEADDPAGTFSERGRAHDALVHDRLAQGMGLRRVARHLGWGTAHRPAVRPGRPPAGHGQGP
ncbi:hypothetical protein OG762_48655 (plasmid) [Streptomyces sp. NBC_01136]|uniref:hypothetical protein n=1 Tax=unclassified Streptomyces TaxID=2593676 RepID=UPI003244DD31|nr:hypothetical protein OG762_48655 [Streptomyces sp. NBC_01136]